MNFGLEFSHTLRMIKKNKYFTALCVLVIALGIAQSLVIFQVINNQLLRVLPFDNGDRFVVFDLKNQAARESYTSQWDVYRYQYLKENTTSYTDMGATQVATLATVNDGESTQTYNAAKLTPNLMAVTGVKPMLGRNLLDSDNQEGAEAVVVLSYRMWVSYYASNVDIVNTRTRINGLSHTIIGVMPEGFGYPVASDLWLPIKLPKNLQPGEEGPLFTIVALLKPGIGRESAGKEVTSVLARLNEKYSTEYKDHQTNVLPFTRQFFDDDGVVTLSKLLTAILILIVALASINVGNLLLLRANERSHEMGVRGALGATRWNLIRNILMESSLICLLGGILGIGLSVVLLWGSVSAQAGPDFMAQPFWMSYDLETDMVLLALALITVIWLLAGGIPAWRASRIDIYETLAGGTKMAGSRAGNWFVMILIGFELIISVFILITNGVTITSLKNEFAVDYGIKAEHFLTASISLPGSRYADSSKQKSYMAELQNQLLSQPGVSKVSFTTVLPSQNMALRSYNLADRDVLVDNKYPELPSLAVSNNYFDTLATPLGSGRVFNDGDTQSSQPVVIIDSKLGKTLWPDEADVVGKQIQLEPNQNGPWLTIIGTVKQPVTGRAEISSDPRRAFYRPMGQGVPSGERVKDEVRLYVMLEVTGQPDNYRQMLKSAGESVDRDVSIFLAKSLDQVLADSVAEFDQLGMILSTIGVVALALAASGIYAIMSRSVMLRTRDISIRRALGLTNGAAVFSFVRRGLYLLVIGVVVGGSLSLLAINALLSTTDIAALPWVFGSVMVIVTVIIFCSTYFPAKRIVAREPGDTLHEG